MSCLSAVLFTATVLERNIFSQPVVPKLLCSLLGSSHVKDYVITPLVSRAHVKALYCLSCVFCIFCLQDIVIVVRGCLRSPCKFGSPAEGTIRNWL